MKKWFQNLGYRMQVWMQGRYGNDELSRLLTIVGIVLLLLSLLTGLRLLYLIGLALWIWSLVRCYSKNISRRRAERDAYLRFTGRIKSKLAFYKRRWSDRKTHRYYRCKQCKTVLRVPRGKGRIKVRCPKCHSEFFKNT